MTDRCDVDFQVDGLRLKLRHGHGIFLPTLTTQLLASCVRIPEGAEVLDLGCGMGPLGIMAAKKGAALVACVDVMAEACRVAWDNVAVNGVAEKVEVFTGHLFEPVRGRTFDVIINDVSAVAEEAARISPWYPEPVPTGGMDGTAPTLEMLAEVREFLKPGGKLYFPVLSLCRSERILNEAEQVFGRSLEVLLDRMVPFCPEFYENLPILEDLQRRHLVEFTARKSRRLWNLKVLMGTKV